MPVTRVGLQGKIILIAALTVVSVLGVSTYIATWLIRLPVEEEIYRKALAQARGTAHQLANDKALQDPARLQRALKHIEHDLPGVKQSDVYRHDPESRLVATTAPHGEHQELDRVPGIENYFEFERPDEDTITIETREGAYWIMGTTIREEGRPVGCLNLRVSKSRSSVITERLVTNNLVLMLASLAAVILVIHVFFLRRVRGPVKEMIRVMEAAEGGQLHVRARVKSHDEIAQQADHLNRMLARIENFNTELERKVREATAELAQRNEELRRIYEELFETQKNLARLERLAVAGQLAASIAHEIGTPLNSISGHVQLLARKLNGNDASKRRLEVIEKQIDNIVRTVKQLLSWTRKFDLHLEPVDLRHLLEESVLISSPVLQLRKIKIQTKLDPDCPRIQGDPAYLQQVFLNLINNSMDAMPSGGELSIRLRYPATLPTCSDKGDGAHGGNLEGDAVAIELRDTGSGMSPETLAHIFEPMFTTKRIGTGAGLGLAICNQITRQHAGTIEVQSEIGRGTRFTIVLPLDCREKGESSGITYAAAVNPVR